MPETQPPSDIAKFIGIDLEIELGLVNPEIIKLISKGELGQPVLMHSKISGHDFWIIKSLLYRERLEGMGWTDDDLPVWSVPEINRAINDRITKNELINAMDIKAKFSFAKYYSSHRIEK